ncbi:chorismate mutase [Candidatus Woesearchaeota archaeon]|nr:chorismate mutase [Candidatus Woesearchaeota archaeon]
MVELAEFRAKIDKADDRIIEAIIARNKVRDEVLAFKKENHITLKNIVREDYIVKRLQNKYDLDPAFILSLYELIFAQAKI